MPLPELMRKTLSVNSSESSSSSSSLKEKLDFFRRKVSQGPGTGSGNPSDSWVSRSPSGPLGPIEDEPNWAELQADEEVFLSACSSLSRSLIQFLQDQNAMGYFVPYLEARDALNLVKFWMDVQGFKAMAMPVKTPVQSAENSDVPNNNLPHEGSVDSGYEACPSTSAAMDAVSIHSSSTHPDEDEHHLRVRTQDAVEIYQRYIAPNCPFPIPLSSEVRQEIVQGICTETGLTGFDCFQPAESFICDLLEREYYGDFLRSDSHAKYQVDVLTSGNVRMTDILHDDTLLFHFMEFMDSIGHRDLLEFWMAANNFRQNHDHGEHLESDAIVIYERFISMQATSPLGLSNAIRSRIEEAICSESGIQSSCFDPALILVIQALERKFLKPFLDSSLYRNYLSELLSKIQTGPYATPQSSTKKKKHSLSGFRRRSGSNSSMSTTCSSMNEVNSISTQNTLLASMSRSKSDSHGHMSRGVYGSSMSTESVVDLDQLWRGQKFGGVQNIGEVDRLGRYKSRYQPLVENEEKKQTMSSKLGRAMKRLVHSDIDKMKEDMAWQMAEMIVKDILDVTKPDLNGCDNSVQEGNNNDDNNENTTNSSSTDLTCDTATVKKNFNSPS